MRLFRRRRVAFDPTIEPSRYEVAAENPELLAAEESVRRLPPPPPSMNPFFDVVMGSRPAVVSFPEPEQAPDTP